MSHQPIPVEELNLRESIQAVVATIEAKAGHKVEFLRSDLWKAEGAGEVGEDGVPRVLLAPHGIRELTILHELLHIECELLGYPRTWSKGGTQTLPEKEVSHAIGEWFSIVEHQVIYPKMEKMGYDPRGDLDEKFRKGLLASLFNVPLFLYKNPNRNILFLNLVGSITRLFTEGKRSVRKEAIKAMRPFPDALAMSQKLAERILHIEEWNPGKVREVAESCLEDMGIPRSGIYHYIDRTPSMAPVKMPQ